MDNLINFSLIACGLLILLSYSTVIVLKTLDKTIGINYCFSCNKKIKRNNRLYERSRMRKK